MARRGLSASPYGPSYARTRAEFARDRGKAPSTLPAPAGSEPLRSVSFVYDGLPGWLAETPRLGSVLAASHHRGRGIGTAPIQPLLARADAREWPRLLLFTEPRRGYFGRFDFEPIGMHAADERALTVTARRCTYRSRLECRAANPGSRGTNAQPKFARRALVRGHIPLCSLRSLHFALYVGAGAVI